jgi:hypothetical protein
VKKTGKLRHKGRKEEGRSYDWEAKINTKKGKKEKRIKGKTFLRNQKETIILFRITGRWNRLRKHTKGDWICYNGTISFGYCA